MASGRLPVNRSVRLLALGLALVLASCSREEAAVATGVPALPETATVQMREVELTYSAEAIMEAVRQSTVAAQIAGRVIDVRFDVGDYVRKGDVIVRIDERTAAKAVEASEAQVSEAQAALRNARANYERSRQLVAQKFISQAALDKAEAEYRAAQAHVSSLLASAGQVATERSFATIVAPYSGVVSARHVEVGEMATPGKPLMTGFDPATLRAVATISQAQLQAVESGGKARIEIPSLGKWIEARRIAVVPAADPRTHTLQVRLELPGDVRGVYPGVYARAHFITGRAPRLLVPRSAVIQRSEVTGAYVVDEAGVLRLRQIRLGTAGDEHAVEVLAGLKEGERVAVQPVKALIDRHRAP